MSLSLLKAWGLLPSNALDALPLDRGMYTRWHQQHPTAWCCSFERARLDPAPTAQTDTLKTLQPGAQIVRYFNLFSVSSLQWAKRFQGSANDFSLPCSVLGPVGIPWRSQYFALWRMMKSWWRMMKCPHWEQLQLQVMAQSLSIRACVSET